MKDYSLGLYEKSMPAAAAWRDRLSAAKRSGFDFVEISVDETDEKLARLHWDKAEKDELIRDMKMSGCPIKSMCLSGHRRYPLGSGVQSVAQRSMKIMDLAILLANDLGIRMIQLAGYDVYYNETSTLDTKERFMDNLYKSVMLAAKYGVILGLETMENDFMNTVEKAMYFVSEINSPYLQVYPDVGNITNATPNATYDIRKGRGHIAAAHLKETKEGVYRDLKFGEGRVDFKTIIQILKRQGVRFFTAEFWWDGKDDWTENLCKTHSFLAEYLEK